MTMTATDRFHSARHETGAGFRECDWDLANVSSVGRFESARTADWISSAPVGDTVMCRPPWIEDDAE